MKQLIALFLCTLTLTTFAEDPYAALLSQRHSGYNFDSARPVTHAQLEMLVEAARLTPSSFNEQPWYFIVCNRATHPDTHQKLLNTLVEFNQGWAKNAPVLIIAIAASKSAASGKENRWAQYDTGAATLSMMLQATSLGLLTHQMGGFDEEKLRQAFALPADNVPMAVMAVGYEAKKELPPKKRKPISENFFMGTWGIGFE